ncbi:MAG: hypothetical protein IJ741_10215 [Schwartzia sp.]|nr:hypothetical protein [Schwartzia sp. (in: firmicutes)]
MWTKKSLCVLSFMCAALLLCFSPAGICSETQATSREETLTASMRDWNALKANNAAQKKALQESQTALTEARKELNASREALTEAKALLESSQMTSTEAQERLATLLQEYEIQKAELIALRQELSALKAESKTASDALTKANQYLQDTKKEIEANEAIHRKREAQLERQRLLWQLACLVVGGVAIAR